MGRSTDWIRTLPTRRQRLTTLLPSGSAVLVSWFLLSPPSDGFATNLRKVVEEAKKPAAEQETVDRATRAYAAPAAEDDDGPSGFWGVLGMILGLFGEDECEPPAPSFDSEESVEWVAPAEGADTPALPLEAEYADSVASDFDAEPSTDSAMATVFDLRQDADPSSAAFVAAGYTEAAAVPTGAEPPWLRDERRFCVGIRSLSLTPDDDVCASLDGGGFGAEVFLTPSLRLGMGLYWLRGEIEEGSPARGGITAPSEFAWDAHVRGSLFERGIFAINGIAGLRLGEIEWDYVNPVYALDEFGLGAEIGHDSLYDFSGYVGVGLVPLQTHFLQIGVDVGAGWRGYFSETYEGFTNDLFADGWMTQLSIQVAMVF